MLYFACFVFRFSLFFSRNGRLFLNDLNLGTGRLFFLLEFRGKLRESYPQLFDLLVCYFKFCNTIVESIVTLLNLYLFWNEQIPEQAECIQVGFWCDVNVSLLFLLELEGETFDTSVYFRKHAYYAHS
jgi:hypothetical protein